MKFYVAGHTGMVGREVARLVEQHADHHWIGETRSRLDLTNREEVFDFLGRERPEVVIIAAAKVGGIEANRSNPVEFMSENIQIATNLLDGAHHIDTPRVVFLGSSCIYPKYASQPILEDSLLNGPLEPTNEAYALAKIAGVKLLNFYREQYGMDWVSLMPTNLYGQYDNFDTTSSHVIPGIISKMLDAKLKGEPKVTLWGDGSPLREFLHVSDLADAILKIATSDITYPLMNVGSGEEVSIADLATLIQSEIGYIGEIEWDQTKPNGTPRKILDSSKIRAHGWAPRVRLVEGVRAVVRSLEAQRIRHD